MYSFIVANQLHEYRKFHLLESMSFSNLSRLSNSKSILKTMAEKQMHIITLAEATETHSAYFIKPLATYKMYRKYETIMHPKYIKPKKILQLNALWCFRLMPKVSDCFRTVRKSFIFLFHNYSWSKILDSKRKFSNTQMIEKGKQNEK